MDTNKDLRKFFAILVIAALSGCYSIRDFREWTDSQEHTITMLINANNNLHRRVETLETDVRYLNRHALPVRPRHTTLQNAETALQNAPSRKDVR